MAEETEKKKFKVADNRRFDNDGNERDATMEEVERVLPGSDSASGKNEPASERLQRQPPAKPSTPEMTKTSVEPTPSVRRDDDHTESSQGTITFSSFVISLATQALVQMGQMAPPQGTEIPPDPAAAKQTIDLLEIFESKTKGNLDENETKLMEQILHSLRLSYVNSMNT